MKWNDIIYYTDYVYDIVVHEFIVRMNDLPYITYNRRK